MWLNSKILLNCTTQINSKRYRSVQRPDSDSEDQNLYGVSLHLSGAVQDFNYCPTEEAEAD